MVPCLSCQSSGLRQMYFTLQQMLAVLRLVQSLEYPRVVGEGF